MRGASELPLRQGFRLARLYAAYAAACWPSRARWSGLSFVNQRHVRARSAPPESCPAASRRSASPDGDAAGRSDAPCHTRRHQALEGPARTPAKPGVLTFGLSSPVIYGILVLLWGPIIWKTGAAAAGRAPCCPLNRIWGGGDARDLNFHGHPKRWKIREETQRWILSAT